MNEFEWLSSLTEDPIPDEEWVRGTRQRIVDLGLLRRFVDDPDPGDQQLVRARRRLQLHIASHHAPARKRQKRWLPAAAAILIGAAALSLVALPPAPAVGLLDVAIATELLPADEFGGAHVIRTVEEEILVIDQFAVDGDVAQRVVYVLPRVQVRRQAVDGSLQIETLPGTPIFIASADDSLWREAVEERVRPGVATIETFAAPEESGSGIEFLTEDASLLARQLADDVAQYGDPAVPDSAEIMERVANIYRATLVTPAERAALLRVLAQLGEIRETPWGAGGVDASIVHDGRGAKERLTLRFDAAGWLVFEEVLLLDGLPEIDVPPGVALQRSHYSTPRPSP